MQNSIVIAYATPSHYKLAERLRNCVLNAGLQYRLYTHDWLVKTSFYAQNMGILRSGRGAGYWAWKPYIIQHALLEYKHILYLDASTVFTDYPGVKDYIAANPTLSAVRTYFCNRAWTKRDCFRIMDCDNETYWNSDQCWAGVVTAGQSDSVYLQEWLKYCTIPDCINDKPSIGNFPDFVDHRHDQSILTNILIKYGLPMNDTQIFSDG